MKIQEVYNKITSQIQEKLQLAHYPGRNPGLSAYHRI